MNDSKAAISLRASSQMLFLRIRELLHITPPPLEVALSKLEESDDFRESGPAESEGVR